MVKSYPQHDDPADRLPDAIFRDVVALVAETSDMEDKLSKKRKALFDGLSRLIDADVWLWAHSYVEQGDMRIRNLQYQHCGRLNWRQSIAYVVRVFGCSGVPPENARLTDLARQGAHFTRSICQLVGNDTWMDRRSRKYVRILGVDDHVYSIVPNEQCNGRTYINGVAFGRRLGRPFFTALERKTIHIVVGAVGWLHKAKLPRKNEDQIETLPIRFRPILPMLLSGATHKEIAAAKHLAHGTIKKYSGAVQHHFGVKNRYELIRKFSIGDGGEVA